MEVAERQTILSPGDMLGCYRIDSFLGQGGFGVTYIARDTMLDIQVAIKEYLPEKIAERVSDTTVQARDEGDVRVFRRGLANFLKEARTLARFKHPNIVRVMSVFELNGTAYMVMEYERGHDLKLLFNRRERVSEADLKSIIGPIMDGLDEVHRHGFIHRDIKPANILVRENGTPVLLDFGSARLAVGHDTDTLTTMVTVGFAPLEQYSGLDDQQGPWTDIYGLGAVLYFAITGEAPLDSTLRGAAVLNDKPDPLVPLTTLAPPGYSPSFCRAVDWALQFKVSARPQNLAQWRVRLFNGEIPAVGDFSEAASTPTWSRESTLADRQVGPSVSSADAPTVLKSRQHRPAPVTDLENASTVLIDSSWDIADITQTQRIESTRLKVLPIVAAFTVLVAAIGLAIFKPWQSPVIAELPNTAPVVVEQVASEQPESVLRKENGSEADSKIGGATEIVETPAAQGRAEQTQPGQLAEQSESLADGPDLSEQPAKNAGQVVQIEQPVQGEVTIGAVGPNSQDASGDATAQREADRQARQEMDRAVQRLEARRQAQLQEKREVAASAEMALSEAAERESDRQVALAREAGGVQRAEAAEQVNDARPAISNSDMSSVLTRFNALSRAIQQRDSKALRQITVQSDRKYAYFDYVFRTFDSVEASVGNISASRQDQTVRGTLTIRRMIRDNGDIAIPPEEFRNIPIYSVKERQWSAIHW